MINRIKKAVEYLLYSKKELNKPKKVPILIFDEVGSELFLNYFKKEDTEIIHIRKEKINLYVLIKTIFSLKVSGLEYISQYIKCVEPRIVITFIDNNTNFYHLKTKSPNPKYIVVQNSIRDGEDPSYPINKAQVESRNFFVDYAFCYNKEVASRYSSSSKCESLIIGSFKNNIIGKLENELPNINRLTFVSQYRNTPDIFAVLEGKAIYRKNFYEPDRIMVKKLQSFCIANNLEFAIAGTTSSEKGNEFKFFESALGDSSWIFLPKKDIFSSYYEVFNSQYVVCLESTLAYEALSRGKRVGFFPCRKKYIDVKNGRNFDAAFDKKGEFWTDEITDNEFEKVMNFVVNSNDVIWNSTVDKYKDDLIAYEPGNTKFIDLMKELEVPIKDKFND